MKGGGDLYIEILKEDNQVIINIQDTGCGIAKEYLSEIFNPFFTTSIKGKGTGLGLSLCYAIIDSHKGSISVKSEIDKGSVFKVCLPLID